MLLHPEVVKYIAKLRSRGPRDAERCAEALRALNDDPFRSRPSVDIARWEGSEFDYRLRVGRHRFGYRVDKKTGQVSVDDAWFK